jgi:uncharacterized protein (TIGR02246 family)
MQAKCVALLVACVSSPLVAQRAPASEAPFREHAAAYAAALNKRDATAVASLFAPDGDQVIVDGPRLVGRDAIRDATQRELATWPAARHFTLAVTGVRMLTPNVAIVETTATFSEGLPQSNRGTLVMVRQSGKWLIAALRVYPDATAQR